MDTEWQEEQNRVNSVIKKIAWRLRRLREEVGGVKKHMVELKQDFWDEVTVNLDHPDDLAETYTSIRQQAGVLSEREQRHRHALKQLRSLEKLQDSPYFGRIDLVEDETGEALSIYLGTGSFLDDDGETFLIYDWRAPISSVYYDYPPGPVQYETPDGIVTGQMHLKRQFVIRGGHIQSMFDTGETIGDELLQQVLGQSADTRMKNIVATIQKEQNRVIRNDKSKLLIVQGAAGSGKTSAALQRVAYLLYKYRNSLNADQIVLFSPNPIFNSYVSTVLPELGEENMQQTTFQEYLQHRLHGELKLEDPYEQMEYVLTAREDPEKEARLRGMSFKASAVFLDIVRHFTESLHERGMVFRPIVFRGKELVGPGEIAAYFYSLDNTASLHRKIEDVRDWLLEGLKRFEREESEKPWVEDEMELLDKRDYVKVHHMIRKKQKKGKAVFNEHELEKKLLGKMVVRNKLKPLRSKIKRLRFIDVPAIYQGLFDQPDRLASWVPDGQIPDDWNHICRQTTERLDRGELPYEDAAPYIYLKEHLYGFPSYSSVRHVIVDEGQDYSPLQYAFLKRLFPRSKMTVLGDFNQAIHAHSETLDFDTLNGLFGKDDTKRIRLTRSYRSTRQIVEFTSGLVPESEIVPFHREGPKPTVTIIPEGADAGLLVAKRVEKLVADGHGTIAVICKTEKECAEAYDALKTDTGPLSRIHRITGETRHFEKGVVVIPFYLAKGVEFDAVIVYDASVQAYGGENDRKRLYTACTRAMHELHLFASGRLSPLISALDPETYTIE